MSDGYFEEGIIQVRVRLKRQEEILNKAMDVLETVDMSGVRDILDIACGTGRWSVETALKHPEKNVVGVDKAPGVLDFAHAQATVEDCENVHFEEMDVMDLKFPDASFDIVNARLICGFLHRTKWPVLLAECMRILRPGGTLIMSEQGSTTTNEYEYEQRGQCIYTAFHRAGYSFADDERMSHLCVGIMLPGLFRQAGLVKVSHRSFDVDYSAGAEAHEAVLQNFIMTAENAEHFIVKAGAGTHEDVEQLIAYLKSLVNKPGFTAFWHFISAYGYKS